MCQRVTPVSVSTPTSAAPPPSAAPPLLNPPLSCWPWRHHAHAEVRTSCDTQIHTFHSHSDDFYKNAAMWRGREAEENKTNKNVQPRRWNPPRCLWEQTTGRRRKTIREENYKNDKLEQIRAKQTSGSNNNKLFVLFWNKAETQKETQQESWWHHLFTKQQQQQQL